MGATDMPEALPRSLGAGARSVLDSLHNAPALCALLRGPTHVYGYANARSREALGGIDPIGVRAEQPPRLTTREVLDEVFAPGTAEAFADLRAGSALLLDGR